MVTHTNPPTIFSRILAFSGDHHLIKSDATIMVGLSGGPDSVFLLHFLVHIQKKYNLTIIAAHLDHGWRAESAQDVTFCKNVAADLGIPFFYATATDLHVNVPYNGSKEEVGRKLRRHFFEQLAGEKNANCVALAHHTDDQQETFFIRLLRGASLTGLTGMKPQDGLYIRPLLELSKKEIVDYLHENSIAYLTDSTNNSPAFLRNRIRAQVIPALKVADDRFDQNFKSTLTKLQETEQFLTTLTAIMFEQIKIPSTTQTILDLTQWRMLDRFLQQRIIIYWLCSEKVPFGISDAFVQEIARFLISPRGGEHALNQKWAIVQKSQQAYIKRLLQ
jgi:tRNA(Ile)-lysidine synthase